jgi:hypothetical protein
MSVPHGWQCAPVKPSVQTDVASSEMPFDSSARTSLEEDLTMPFTLERLERRLLALRESDRPLVTSFLHAVYSVTKYTISSAISPSLEVTLTTNFNSG